MDFKTQQDSIKQYIKTNLPTLLSSIGLDDFDDYIDDYLDFDLYPKKKQLFYDFGYYNYDYLSNESNSEELQFTVFMAFRGDKRANLKDNMLKYTSAFYQMFEDSGCNFGGIADYGIISTVTFYPAAEGNPDIKVAELQLRLNTEK